ncbi:hypothetical protein, partial [Phenylobacterium sp.]|uniref:hypothetical protein n=1 Tax=Phenylobacterium sp. TaxID=1871053 RepID=UPI002E35DD66
MNIGFAVAAAIGLLGFGIHVFWAAPRLVRPFLKLDLNRWIKWLFYLCFHIVSLLILTMTLVFWWAARDYHGHPAAAVLGGGKAGAAVPQARDKSLDQVAVLPVLPRCEPAHRDDGGGVLVGGD